MCLQEELIEVLAFFRQEHDRRFFDSIFDPKTATAGPTLDWLNTPRSPSYMHPAVYPAGWCCDIRELIYASLMYSIEVDHPHPVIQALRYFKQHGGIISKLYGIIRIEDGVFFQNAIRIGNLYVDAAPDAGLPGFAATQVLLRPLEGSAFYEIATYQDFHEVLHRYNHERPIAMQEYFPGLAPLIPAFTLNSAGDVRLSTVQDLGIRNQLLGFTLAQDYMIKLGAVRLPAPVERRFLKAAALAEKVLRLGPAFSLRSERGHPAKLCELARSYWGDLRLLQGPEHERKCLDTYYPMYRAILDAQKLFNRIGDLM